MTNKFPQRGRSFVNSVLAVKGVSKNEIFFREKITVTCSKGIISPSIFEDEKWCACMYVLSNIFNFIREMLYRMTPFDITASSRYWNYFSAYIFVIKTYIPLSWLCSSSRRQLPCKLPGHDVPDRPSLDSRVHRFN